MDKIIKFIYENQEVEFDMGGNSLMVNATEMAKLFKKRVDVFLKTDHAKQFIEVLEFTPFGGNSEPLKREEIIQTRGQSGTWMHRVLALKFAAWLNPSFELWVYSAIDEILFGYYRKMEANIKESGKRKAEIEKLERQLLENPKYQELERLKLQEKQAAYRRSKENKDQMELFKNMYDTDKTIEA